MSGPFVLMVGYDYSNAYQGAVAGIYETESAAQAAGKEHTKPPGTDAWILDVGGRRTRDVDDGIWSPIPEAK